MANNSNPSTPAPAGNPATNVSATTTTGVTPAAPPAPNVNAPTPPPGAPAASVSANEATAKRSEAAKIYEGDKPVMVGGQQFVPTAPGHPKEFEDFAADGTIKNAELERVRQAERAALLGEAPAPPFAPATERKATEAVEPTPETPAPAPPENEPKKK